jgi:hypothetical protein
MRKFKVKYGARSLVVPVHASEEKHETAVFLEVLSKMLKKDVHFKPKLEDSFPVVTYFDEELDEDVELNEEMGEMPNSTSGFALQFQPKESPKKKPKSSDDNLLVGLSL